VGALYHCALLGLIEIDALDQGAGAALIWLLCLRPDWLQAGLTGFLNAPISLETGNPGHTQILPSIDNAKIGKVFHGNMA
jgi:hypothetical protein